MLDADTPSIDGSQNHSISETTATLTGAAPNHLPEAGYRLTA